MSVQPFGEAFLDLMLLALAHGTALVLLTWLASATLLRRCRPSVHAALWTVVLVKFLLPPVLPGDVGLSPLLSSLLPPSADSVIARPEASRLIAQNEGANLSDDGNSIDDARLHPGPARGRRTQARLPRPLPAALLIAYTTLVSLFGARALLRAHRMRRRVRRLPAAGARLAGEVAAAAAKLGLARPPRVLTDAAATSPCVVGAWSPALVMPASLPARFDAAAREALIIHELAHIRRGDTLVRWLRNAARLIFFFWPPVWWLCRRVERFSEMACDEWAVRLSSVSPRAYAEALLDVAKAARRGGGMSARQIALASRDEGLMAARFEMILSGDYGGRPRLTALASAALMAWGLFAVAGDASAPPPVRANATESAAEVFDEAADAGRAPRGQALVSNPSASTTRRTGPQRGDEPRRRPVPARRPDVPDQRAAAQPPSEDVARSEQTQGRDEVTQGRGKARPRLQSETHKVEPRAVDLDGDGTISDFEAGYSAGLSYRNRMAARGGAPSGLPDPAGARPRGDATALRRRETELRERLRARPGDDTP